MISTRNNDVMKHNSINKKDMNNQSAIDSRVIEEDDISIKYITQRIIHMNYISYNLSELQFLFDAPFNESHSQISVITLI